MTPTLAERATQVLMTADPVQKTALSLEHAAAWAAVRDGYQRASHGDSTALGGDTLAQLVGRARPPDRPARPSVPELREPRDVPKRRPGTRPGRIALLHAVAHIELNAVDLHWDIVSRFSDVAMPAGFFDDWVRAAADEARHFTLICTCLEQMGSHYGALPAHAGMWRAAEDTTADLRARLAVVPMVLEARGLDVTPGMIGIFRSAGDHAAVAALETIYAEEVSHVAYGSKWFNWLCGRDGLDPKEAFHSLVRRHFHGTLKPPFNEERRAEAGIPPDFYWPLAESR